MRKFNVTGMSCAACSARVEKAVGELKGIESCAVNLLTNSMAVKGSTSDSEIITAVVKAGYGAAPKGSEANNRKTADDRKKAGGEGGLVTRLTFSLFLLLPLMYISMGHVMWGAPLPRILAENPTAIALTELLLSGIITVVNQKFFVSGFKGTDELKREIQNYVKSRTAPYKYPRIVEFREALPKTTSGKIIRKQL